MPHLMLATVFAEHFGVQPAYAHAIQVGGATGLAMLMLAHELVDAGVAKNILVVAGENRLTGQTRDSAMQALAQVGHPQFEVAVRADDPGLLWIDCLALHARIRPPVGGSCRVRGADA